MLVAIVGESGVGKTTLGETLNKTRIITYTTRNPRENEKNDIDYHFIKKEKFKELIEKNYFFEYTEYADNFYGTAKESITKGISKDGYIIVDLEGYKNLKKNYPEEVIGVYIKTAIENSITALKNRKISKKDYLNRVDKLKTLEKENIEKEFTYVYVNDFTLEGMKKFKLYIQEMIMNEK